MSEAHQGLEKKNQRKVKVVCAPWRVVSRQLSRHLDCIHIIVYHYCLLLFYQAMGNRRDLHLQKENKEEGFKISTMATSYGLSNYKSKEQTPLKCYTALWILITLEGGHHLGWVVREPYPNRLTVVRFHNIRTKVLSHQEPHECWVWEVKNKTPPDAKFPCVWAFISLPA